jgi:Resolvase, N terminal domain
MPHRILTYAQEFVMKRAALYMRVSTVDQHPETQLLDLRQMAAQRGLEIVEEYTDRISGTKARRPGLDQMMRDGRRGQFDVVLVWASDRIARSVKHFLDVLDELNRLNIEFISFRENIDTGGPLGRAVVVIIGAIAELDRNLIIERVRGDMHRMTEHTLVLLVCLASSACWLHRSIPANRGQISASPASPTCGRFCSRSSLTLKPWSARCASSATSSMTPTRR